MVRVLREGGLKSGMHNQGCELHHSTVRRVEFQALHHVRWSFCMYTVQRSTHLPHEKTGVDHVGCDVHIARHIVVAAH